MFTSAKCAPSIALIVVAISSFADSRAINISNTWVLPEEGFPVFYRYFRDKISWYEADAVCQFHHANLVTVDNTLQFDAVRAYLKELDIISQVWIGLSANSENDSSTWSTSEKPATSTSSCASIDPASDLRWYDTGCLGPQTASFLCELPVPSWASNCLVTSLPSLTITFLPEQSALELTADCSLEGTKQIICKGDVEKDELVNELRCGSASQNNIDTTSFESQTSTKSSIWTSNSVDFDSTGSKKGKEIAIKNEVPTSPTIRGISVSTSPKATSSNHVKQVQSATMVTSQELREEMMSGEIINSVKTNDERDKGKANVLELTEYRTEKPPVFIDPHLDNLNNKTRRSNFSETLPDYINVNKAPEKLMLGNISKDALPEHSNGRISEQITDVEEGPVEIVPEAQARPNRNRALTRSQGRSFYPYFFSRVLG